ncbi:Flp family type IVb pilin [uncultured Sphingomonas sp.]|uniref:Flp family type IVb pilin n=1 Tax=uncultured Sphingomonas sp. TaxID=158754 RepID=UPI0025ED9149|nr:Flp family type IVb pilin [uncultured Sphingomonas sp.]
MSDARYIRAKLGRYVRLLAQSRRGGTAVEYAMIIAVIFLAVAAAISQTADANLAIWDDVSGKFAEAMQTP